MAHDGSPQSAPGLSVSFPSDIGSAAHLMSDASVSGIVVAGHGVASGRCPDPRFPSGSIALQAPLFRERGVDLAVIVGGDPVLGTINIDLSPLTPAVAEPEILVPGVTWSNHMPTENFWLFRARLRHAGEMYRAVIYMPDPATKPAHFQPARVVEVIAARVSGLNAGDYVDLAADPAFIRFGQ